MRVLALDVGDRRIGVAVSDPLGLTAQPQPTIDRRAVPEAAEAVAALADQWQVGAVVVGLPLTLRGRHGPQAEQVAAFVKTVEPLLRCPVVYWDERFTTQESSRSLRDAPLRKRRERGLVDQTAALEGVGDALGSLATFVGADTVVIRRVTPHRLRRAVITFAPCSSSSARRIDR